MARVGSPLVRGCCASP